MDEADWFASADAVGMLRALFPMPGPHSSPEHTRLGRLYLAACARRLWPYLPWACRKLVEVAEAYADDPHRDGVFAALTQTAQDLPGLPATAEYWDELAAVVRRYVNEVPGPAPRRFRTPDDWTQAARLVAFLYAKDIPPFQQVRAGYHNPDYVRDLFAPSVRPVGFEDGWRTDRTIGLARAMYDARAFDRMPILADALEEAGCGEAAVLDHCRDPRGVHVRGCWVVDRVLGRA